MSEPKCKVGWCHERPLAHQLLCKKHFRMLPWEVRRALNKMLSHNDMQPCGQWEQLMIEAYAYLMKQLKTLNKPPHPADVGGEYEERNSRYGVQVRLL